MTDPVPEDALEAATAYEHLHVPALFRQFAPVVLDAAGVGPAERVLDVACGTGILAREAAARLGDGASVVGIDPDPGMLAVAGRLAPEVEWRQGVAEALPFEDDAFDAVVSQFGLMFFTDRARAVREMWRVLAPGGGLSVAVWDSLDRSPAYAEEVQLLDRVAGVAAGDALRAPFRLGDEVALRAVFAEAGVEAVDIRVHRGVARFPSIRRMVEADLRGWLPVMGVTLSEREIGDVLEGADDVLARYMTAEGQVRFEAPARLVTARKP